MNMIVVIPVIVVLLLLRWKGASMFTWLVAWWVAIYLVVEFGFEAPIPASVVWLYMGIFTLVLALYVTSDSKRFEAVRTPMLRLMTNRRYTLPLILLILLIPGLVAANVYLKMTSPVGAPFFPRTVHPANPDVITVNDKEFNLITLQNPLRELEHSDPEAFRQHVEKGREVYYQNCFYCHGDDTTGNGMFAHGLNPLPTDLKDNIALLQESFLFWRISKGGPGLPEEGGPWESAMPAWENFLSEEEMWQVILFLYDFTDQRPRAREETISE